MNNSSDLNKFPLDRNEENHFSMASSGHPVKPPKRWFTVAKNDSTLSASHAVYIGDLNKAELLAVLWENASDQLGFSTLWTTRKCFNGALLVKFAEKSLCTHSFIDVFIGRPIFLHLGPRTTYVDPLYYDRFSGIGSFQRAVSELRNSKNR